MPAPGLKSRLLRLLPASPPDTSLREIVRLLRCDDKKSNDDGITLFYERYNRFVYTAALRVTGSHEDAEEVVIDVIATLPQRVRRYEERNCFLSWVWTVTRNEAFMRVRRRRDGHVSLEPEHHGATAPHDDRILARVQLYELLDTLPEKDRQVVLMKDVMGYDYRSIAQEMEMTEQAVRERRYRAVSRLRKLFFKE